MPKQYAGPENIEAECEDALLFAFPTRPDVEYFTFAKRIGSYECEINMEMTYEDLMCATLALITDTLRAMFKNNYALAVSGYVESIKKAVDEAIEEAYKG